MKKFYKKEEFVYMDCEFTMSNKKMADLMYAGIISQASFTTIWSMDAHEYSRSQNSRNRAWLKVNIHPNAIDQFETISECKLKKPISVTVN